MKGEHDAYMSYTQKALRQRVIYAGEVERSEVELGDDLERCREVLCHREERFTTPRGRRVLLLRARREDRRYVMRKCVERDESPAGLKRVCEQTSVLGASMTRVITDALQRTAACASGRDAAIRRHTLLPEFVMLEATG